MNKILFIIILINFINADQEAIFWQEFGSKGSGLGEISSNIYATFDDEGNIYISDTQNKKILVFTFAGKIIFEIAPSKDDKYKFNSPGDIAVDKKNNIYVTDWQITKIEDKKLIYKYEPCIHKFDSFGNFLGTIFLDLSTKLAKKNQTTSFIIDENGDFALAFKDTDYNRKILITAYDENLYVLDNCMVYKFNSAGELISFFDPAIQVGLEETSSIIADNDGNLYIADHKKHCVLKFSSEGKFLLSIGEKGCQEDKIKNPLYINIVDDKLVIMDSTEYINKYQSYLFRKEDDHTFKKGKYKKYESTLLRFPIFDFYGNYKERLFCEIPLFDEKFKDIKILGQDKKGNLFFIDPERNIIQKYFVRKKRISWKNIDKTLLLQNIYETTDNKIKNPESLVPYDFRVEGKFKQIYSEVKFSYDISETLFVTLLNSIFWFKGIQIERYPGDYANKQLQWMYDDKVYDDYTAGEILLGIQTTFDHNPYNYRSAMFFSFAGGGKYRFNIHSIPPEIEDYKKNKFAVNEDMWWYNFGIGYTYDIKRDLCLTFVLEHYVPTSYVYSYKNEEDELKSTISSKHKGTKLYIGLETAF